MVSGQTRFAEAASKPVARRDHAEAPHRRSGFHRFVFSVNLLGLEFDCLITQLCNLLARPPDRLRLFALSPLFDHGSDPLTSRLANEVNEHFLP